jgi:hypothetical protein
MEQITEGSSLLQAATHASHLAQQESEKAQMTPATSGLKCLESYNRQDRLGLCVKMLKGTLPMGLIASAMIWRKKVTKCNRLLYQLAPLNRRTFATEFGLLRTPLAMEGGESWVAVDKRRQKMRDAGDNRTGNLYKLTQEAQKLDGVEDGVLKPEFVEWLMGYPIGWTDVSHSETQ